MDVIETEMKTQDQLRKDTETIKGKLPEVLDQLLDGSELKEGLSFELVFRPSMKSARYNSDTDRIHFGTNNRELENLKVARKTLVHEAIHAAGMNHCPEMRSLDFYSNFRRDSFTDKVMKKLDWQTPTKKEVVEKGKKKGVYVPEKRLDYKYAVYCPSCGCKWYRKIKSKFVKHPERYRCTECDVALKSRKLTSAEKRNINSKW